MVFLLCKNFYLDSSIQFTKSFGRDGPGQTISDNDDSHRFNLMALTNLLEIVLGHSALGTNPSVRQLFKRGSGLYAVLRVSLFRVIDITASRAFPFLHHHPPRNFSKSETFGMSRMRRRKKSVPFHDMLLILLFQFQLM